MVFLPLYFILRVISNELDGVLVVMSSILMFFTLPILDVQKEQSAILKPLFQVLVWSFVVICFLLGYLGQKPDEDVYIFLVILGKCSIKKIDRGSFVNL